MKIIHYYALGRSHESGVTAALAAWTMAQQEAGHDVEIVTAAGAVPAEYYSVPVRTIQHRGRTRRSLRPHHRELRDSLTRADVVVLHEGWTLSHHSAGRMARRLSKPYIVMPHGVYEPDIISSLKFARIRTPIERRFLNSASAIHLFFPSERALLDNLKVSTKAIVCPTGAELRSPDKLVNDPDGPFLWFGRMDVKHKGLDLLLEGLSLVPPEKRRRVRLAGYDYEGGHARLADLIKQYNLSEHVSLEGPIRGEVKVDALSSAYAYVHPSRWECHSIALLEALASGVPALVGEGAQISGLLAQTGAAAVVPGTAEGWASVLSSYGPLSDEQALGRRKLFAQFNWEVVMENCTSEYRGILG